MDLYFLSLSTLFHDTGNIFDRVNHQTTWSDIYSHIFSGSNDRQEKFILGKIIGAHCGEAQDGTMDTLRLLEEISHHKSQKVATRKIATILRFADELAEGQQRTSLFMQKHFGFPKDSQVYHEFAKSVDRYGIDPENERIALIFNFSLEKAALQDPDWETNIRNLIKFSYKRIAKLDQERQYARYYCDFLMPFKRTTVSTHFWIEDKMLDLNLDDITLTDIIVPGADVGKEISTINPRYELDGIVSQIKDALEKV